MTARNECVLILNGKRIDTGIDFTPTGGLPKGTRAGDLDPGATWYLMQSRELIINPFNYPRVCEGTDTGNDTTE